MLLFLAGSIVVIFALLILDLLVHLKPNLNLTENEKQFSSFNLETEYRQQSQVVRTCTKTEASTKVYYLSAETIYYYCCKYEYSQRNANANAKFGSKWKSWAAS